MHHKSKSNTKRYTQSSKQNPNNSLYGKFRRTISSSTSATHSMRPQTPPPAEPEIKFKNNRKNKEINSLFRKLPQIPIPKNPITPQSDSNNRYQNPPIVKPSTMTSFPPPSFLIIHIVSTSIPTIHILPPLPPTTRANKNQHQQARKSKHSNPPQGRNHHLRIPPRFTFRRIDALISKLLPMNIRNDERVQTYSL